MHHDRPKHIGYYDIVNESERILFSHDVVFNETKLGFEKECEQGL